MRDALTDLISRIAARPDPGFATDIAPRGDFRSARRHRTAFLGAMTLRALGRVPDDRLTPIRASIEEALRKERGGLGSWNYWMRGSEESSTRPLPDDLDTTSCALAALAATPDGIPAEWVARYADLLTLRETSPGGPYRTWIVPSDADIAWQDVDSVVNANIGGFLHRHGCVPAPLLRHLDEAIRDRSRLSPYYPDRSAFRYALAHWYRGEALQELADECRAALRAASGGSSVQALAFALASSCALGGSDVSLIREAAERLAGLCSAGDAEAEAVCIDAVHSGVADHAGSPGFTLALTLEALHGTERVMEADARRPEEAKRQDFIRAVKEWSHAECSAFPEPLRRAAMQAIDAALSADARGDLTSFPSIIARAATGKGIHDPKALAAHVLGWAAYTLHDDIADGDEDVSRLWTANALLRRTFELFLGLFPDDAPWSARCRAAFDRMDAANLEESGSWQLFREDGAWKLPSPLPTASLESLTARSVGVLLAPTALALSASGTEAPIAAMEGYLLHLVAARQLCDDAHDWEDDLRHGRLNHASLGLFPVERAGTRLDLRMELEGLRAAFWEQEVPKLLKAVEVHVREARRHLAGFHGDTRGIADRTLRPLAASLETAVRERDATRDFLKAYRNARGGE